MYDRLKKLDTTAYQYKKNRKQDIKQGKIKKKNIFA